MTSSADTLTKTTPVDTEHLLTELMRRGFQFVHPRDAHGEVVAVVGVRAHGGVIDVVRLEAEDDVTATRMPGGEPDILAPRTVLWQETGSVADVVVSVLALSDDEFVPAAAGAAKGCWVPGHTGRARWLAATA